MKLKIDEKGNAVLQDGHPVYIHPNGTEAPFDAKEATVKIAQLNQENAQFRTSSKEANDKLALFGDMNPTEATEAIQFKNSLAGKKLWDDESVNSRVEAVSKPLKDQLAAKDTAIAEKDATIHKMLVGDKIKSSKFLEKTTYTPADAERLYSDNFKVEDGKLVPYDANGNQIFSTVRAGELADVDEALAHIIGTRSDKDSILKGTGMTGAGSQQSSGGGGQNKFDNLPPAARIAAAREAGIKE